LNFIGVTVDQTASMFTLRDTRHLFEPVPAGGTSPPYKCMNCTMEEPAVVKLLRLDMEPLHKSKL
ncbi:hypothetical protein OS493_002294, partial [Desmophyllum pertusum]